MNINLFVVVTTLEADAMLETDVEYRAKRENNNWSVDRTTANAERNDTAESYRNDVRVEKKKMIKS